jgi:hypothetical protein
LRGIFRVQLLKRIFAAGYSYDVVVLVEQVVGRCETDPLDCQLETMIWYLVVLPLLAPVITITLFEAMALWDDMLVA